MLQKLFALVDGLAAPDNADALQNQEILLPGHLLTISVKACYFSTTWLLWFTIYIQEAAKCSTFVLSLHTF